MSFKSPLPDLNIPAINIVHHIFPPGQQISDRAQWIDVGDPQYSHSPAQALLFAKQFACALDSQKVPRGAVVLLICPNHILIPAIYYGVVGSGRVFSGASPTSTASDFAHIMKVACPEIIIVHSSILKTVLEASRAAGIEQERIFQIPDRRNFASQESTPELRSILSSPSEAEAFVWLNLDGEAAKTTTAAINFSSGTTGLPKGVSISHYNIVANLKQIAFITRTGITAANARWIGFLPMYHAYGQLYSCLLCIVLNVPVYIMAEFNFLNLMQAIQDYRLTTLHLVPPVLRMLAERPESSQYDLSSVQDVLSGAAPLPRDLRERIRERFGIVVREGYGMTELTCAAIQTPMQLAQEGTDSIGVLLPNTTCKLLGPEGDEIGDGEAGEVHIRGPQVFQSYWRNETATQEIKTPNGWLKTGDIAIARDGKFWIVDRQKELIKVNGLQVSPSELEAVLEQNSSVVDAAVVGVTTEKGEAPRAYVSIQDRMKNHTSEKQLVDWVAHRVARHKRLTGGVVIVDCIPRLASGKINRKVIRGWAKGDFSRESRPKL